MHGLYHRRGALVNEERGARWQRDAFGVGMGDDLQCGHGVFSPELQTEAPERGVFSPVVWTSCKTSLSKGT